MGGYDPGSRSPGARTVTLFGVIEMFFKTFTQPGSSLLFLHLEASSPFGFVYGLIL